ncbi:MAG: glycoside hydrolase family 3 C-terminal domain-containing protein [Bacilli bacterium]|nr:glycoside hydrolase family 3 C-terminal domain-containing protein [Bacilli bacterium]
MAKMSNKKFLGLWCPFLALSGALIIGTEVAVNHPVVNSALNGYAGGIWSALGPGEVVKTAAKGTENWNSTYYTTTYGVSTTNNSSTEAAQKNGEAVVEEISNEGMVLLKNKDNALPIPTTTGITMLGRGSADPVYGGSGSGNVDTTTCTSPIKGFQNAGYTVDEDAYNFFLAQKDNYYRQNIIMDNYDASTFFIGEVPTSEYSFAVKSSNVAVVFISRCGGEGLDLSTNLKRDTQTGDEQAILNGKVDDLAPGSWGAESANKANFETRSANAKKEVANYEDGQHQLELSKEEKDMIAFAKANYSKTIVVLNESTTMEVGSLKDDDDIDGLIWAGSPGSTGFKALGNIIAGKVNPSGRTPDLYSADFTADPTFQNFAINSENVYTGVTLETAAAGNNGDTTAHFVQYEEGIYVGYKYYETRFGANETEYNQAVVYPFGYGLSYTTFEKEIVKSEIVDDAVVVTVKVTNTGDVAGKEVVQAYYTAPYTAGGIEKASTVFGDFAKTDLLAKGESEEVTVSIKLEEMASYDYNDKNNNNFKGYELEVGKYTVQIKENSHTVSTNKNGDKLEYTFDVGARQIRKRSSDDTDVTNQFDFMSNMFKDTKTTGYPLNFSRNDWTGTFPTGATAADADATKVSVDGKTVKELLAPYEVVNDDADVMPTMGATNGLSTIDLRGKDYDDQAYDQLLDQLTEAEYNDMAKYLANNAYKTEKIDSLVKPATEDHDGPQGLSTLMGGLKNVAAYMSEPLLAATFNKELGKKMGIAIGEESLSMLPTYSGWYAPAMNTHRSPFAGRNFEYYSEDGVLAGKIATGVVEGAATKGLYAYIKHFALNDQETFRTAAICTWANEQAVREIYLKPFEIVVKNAKMTVDYISDSEGNHSQKEMNAATAVMSSFNRIGTVWAGGSKELMTNVLRDEWGFRGVAISDFNLYNYMSADQGMRAGTDMQLSMGGKSFVDTKSATARIALRKAMHNVLYTVANSNAMNGVVPGTIITYKMYGWRKMFIITDIVLGLFLVGGTVWVVIRVRKNKEQN